MAGVVPRPPFWLVIVKVAALVGFNLAVNFGAGAAFSLATPLFLELGLSPERIPFATSSYPIAGLLQIPIGIWSDRTRTRFGRRRPFMLAGLVFSIIGMAVFANSQTIGNAFPTNSTTVAVAVAITSMAIFNLGFNLIQAPGMALVLETCITEEEKSLGISAIAAAYAIAGTLSYSLVFINFAAVFTFFESNYQALFYIGILVVVLTTIPSIAVGDEPPVDESTVDPSVTFWGACKNTFVVARNMDAATVRILAAYWTSCAAGYPWLIYFTAYVGQDLYKGNPDAVAGTPERTAYDSGVRMGSLALGCMNGVTIILCFLSSRIIGLFKHKPTYLIAHITAFVCLLQPVIPQLQNLPSLFVFCILGAFYNALTTVLPWQILSMAVGQNDTGLYAGLMNAVFVLAQLVSSILAGYISVWMAPIGLGVISTGITSGAVYALIGLPIIVFLIIPTVADSADEQKSLLTTKADPEAIN